MFQSKSSLVAATTVLSLLFSSSAFAQKKTLEERKAGGIVYINPEDEASSLDPTKQADQVSGIWLIHLFEGLMIRDKNGNTVPGTAEKYTVSADGKTYTFTIRKDAKWHDGKPVTAKDFVFAFQRLVTPAYASEYSSMPVTAQITNASDIVDGKKKPEELGVKAVNDSTFEVKLDNPVAFFPSLMSFNVFFPIRKDLVEKFSDKFATSVETMVGNGPFKMTSWVKDSSMRIEKADTYWNAKAIKLNVIEMPSLIKDKGSVYNTFSTGGLDVMRDLDAERFKLAAQEKRSVKTFADGSAFYLTFNFAGKSESIFKNAKKLREAIKFGMNRNEYVNKIMGIPGNKPLFALVPSYMPGSKAGSTYRSEAPMSWKDADTTKAEKLVKEYLAESKLAKVPPFRLLAGDTSQAKKDAEYFQAFLSKLLKTEVTVENVPFKTRLQKMRDQDFDIVIGGWGPDYLDPMTFMDLFTTKNSNNNGKWSNAKFDEIIAKAQASPDLGERVKLFKEAETILVEEAPIVNYYERGRAYLSSEGLTGVRRQAIDDTDLRYASWNTATAKKK